jgi:hypothetical protein
MPTSQHRPIRAQSNASGLSGGQRSACAFADHLAFVLGERRHNVQDEPGSVRHIDGKKVRPGFHQRRYERHAAGKPIELRDEQGRFLALAGVKGFAQLGAVVLAAALDFYELGDDARGSARKELAYRFALSVEAET